VLQHLPDGSYLSNLDGLTVRIIEADLTDRSLYGRGEHCPQGCQPFPISDEQ
jgi:hypothetical protein